MELVILGWALVFAVVAACVFLVARALVQIAAVAYNAIEKRIDAGTATRQSAMLAAGGAVALLAAAFVAATAILVALATLLEGNTF
ncbi:MAG TPA: hypothetical protein VFA01_07140 [Candidatus Dormibacteraeota bacterium]|jgi:hypothetical protein|nr:hypothetical protein [Candidatus Dormibacteraeota bacterium]